MDTWNNGKAFIPESEFFPDNILKFAIASSKNAKPKPISETFASKLKKTIAAPI